MLIDQQFCREHNACYTNEMLDNLFDRPMTIEEVLTRTDGLWEKVPGLDRIWVFIRVATRQQLLNWLALLVERKLQQINQPDPRSVAAIEALRTDSVSFEIFNAAYYAARHAAHCANVNARTLDEIMSNDFVAHVYSNIVLNACEAAFNKRTEDVYMRAYACANRDSNHEQQVRDALEILNHVE